MIKQNAAGFSPNSFQSKYPNPYFNLNDMRVGRWSYPLLKKTWFFAAYETKLCRCSRQIASGTIPILAVHRRFFRPERFREASRAGPASL